MFLIILFGFVLNVVSMQVVGSSIRNLQGALNVGLDQVSYGDAGQAQAELARLRSLTKGTYGTRY